MTKAIIFDCFGVLASERLLPFRNKHFGNNPRLLSQVTELIKQTTTSGLVNYDDFIKTLADLAGISEQEVRDQVAGNIPNKQLFGYITTSLRPAYKIGMLSNISKGRLGQLFTAGQLAVFDAITLSYEIGAVKPAPITYKTIATRLGVNLEECIFIDDQLKYCEGAITVGMQAIQYKSFEQMGRELEGLLG